MPILSVLVPVYNSAPFLKATLTSVLEQTFTDFELIILNDASSDNSESVITSFSDPRIRYYKNNANLGISATRNILCQKATGKYIAILDNDDICLPHRFQTQIDFLEAKPDISIIGSYFELFCSKPYRNILSRFIINLGWIWCQPLHPQLTDIIQGNVLMHPTAMYRRDDFINIHYQDQFSPAEDYDFIVQAFINGLKIANIPLVLLKYNLHGHNFSISHKQAMYKADFLVKQKLKQYYNFPKIHRYHSFINILSKLRLKYFLKHK